MPIYDMKTVIVKMKTFDGNPKPFFFLICFFYLSNLSACPHKAPPVDQAKSDYHYYEQGNRKYESGDCGGARDDFDRVLRRNPNFAPAYYNRGLAKRACGDLLGAVSDYTRAIKFNPGHVKAYYARAWIKYEIKDYEGAVSDYSAILAMNPKDARAYFYRAGSLKVMGRLSSALADYTRALERNSKYVEAYFFRGELRDSVGNFPGALYDYSKAIEYDPNHADAYNNRGVVHSILGNKKKALSDFNKTLLLNPDHHEAHNNLGNLKSFLGDHVGAIAQYNEAIRLSPKFAQAYANRGDSYEKIGEFGAALRDYQEALKLDSDLSAARRNLDQLLQVLNHNPNFMTKVQTILKRMGYYPHKIDGVAGPNTRKAIAFLQAKHTLPESGEITIATYHALLEEQLKMLENFRRNSLEEVHSTGRRKFIVKYPPKRHFETFDSQIPLDVLFLGGVKIGTIIVKVNGQPVKGQPEITYGSNKTSADIAYRLSLAPGDNHISIAVFDDEGVSHDDLKVVYIPSGEARVPEARKWAVVIGIEDYQDAKMPDLNYCVDDAEAFTQILIKQYGFAPQNISLLTDKTQRVIGGVKRTGATASDIRRELALLKRNASEPDTAVIYYSGHGILIPETGAPEGIIPLIAPEDIKVDLPEADGIRLEDIKRIAFCAPQRIFLFLDACFSGGGLNQVKSFNLSGLSYKASSNGLTTGFAHGKGRILISSCLDNQVSVESDKLKHGVFTHFLIEVLQKDYLVTIFPGNRRRLSDVFDYVYHEVQTFTRNAQQPRLDTVDQRGDIFLF